MKDLIWSWRALLDLIYLSNFYCISACFDVRVPIFASSYEIWAFKDTIVFYSLLICPLRVLICSRDAFSFWVWVEIIPCNLAISLAEVWSFSRLILWSYSSSLTFECSFSSSYLTFFPISIFSSLPFEINFLFSLTRP